VAKKRNGARKYLDLKRRVWWFKMDLPKDVRHRFDGKTAYLESLQTSDLRVAMERRDVIERDIKALFAGIRAGKGEASPERTAEERGAAWRQTLAELQRDPKASISTDDEFGLTPYDYARDAAEDEAERLRPKEREWFDRAFAGKVPIDEHLKDYLREADLAPKTTNERRGLVKRFAAWCEAEGWSLQDIDRRVAGRYVSEIITPMHRRTGKKHLGAIRGYWDYLARRGHVPPFEQTGNPWSDQLQPQRGRKGKAGADEEERPFTDSEVKALLYGPTQDEPSQFDPLTREVTVFGLLSGMRETEIVTLRVGDLIDGADGAGRVFDLKDSKTQTGIRQVPVHPDLAELIEKRTADKKPGEWLFHEFADQGNPGDTFGKRFRRYREARGVADKRDGRRRSLVNFHSTRKWLVTQAHRAGIAENIVAAVVGHSDKDNKPKITFGVYSGGPSGKQKRACVEAARLPDPEYPA
jgi:integrase